MFLNELTAPFRPAGGAVTPLLHRSGAAGLLDNSGIRLHPFINGGAVMRETLAASVRALKRQIIAGYGRHVADASFRREVDRLIGTVYDDICAVATVPLESM